MYDLCKSKTICEGGDTIDGNQMDPTGNVDDSEKKVKIDVSV